LRDKVPSVPSLVYWEANQNGPLRPYCSGTRFVVRTFQAVQDFHSLHPAPTSASGCACQALTLARFSLMHRLMTTVITEGVATRRQKTSMVYIARGPSGLSEKGFYIDGLT
jgi:hypothetical protein